MPHLGAASHFHIIITAPRCRAISISRTFQFHSRDDANHITSPAAHAALSSAFDANHIRSERSRAQQHFKRIQIIVINHIRSNDELFVDGNVKYKHTTSRARKPAHVNVRISCNRARPVIFFFRRLGIFRVAAMASVAVVERKMQKRGVKLLERGAGAKRISGQKP